MSKVYQHKIKIYYEDTDAGGVVYYANYLKYMERARSEMIYELLDLSHKDLKINYDIIFLVRSCNIKYLKSAQFEDYLTITTKMIKKTSVRLNLIQETKRKEELLTSAEVELAVEASLKLAAEHIYCKIISMPCQELFNQQPKAYKEKILNETSAKISIEAASTMGWKKYTGDKGRELGIDSFGKSAPYKEIYEHFKLTSNNITKQAKEII